ncbi:cyclase/dehydrase [Streptomyces racemochromogenes]|uniref:Cyclase/dehydrase n=1 Tax=Streptomyces racemochromogenes TaxID=67353 RepID=A0ABW7PDC6_9ACTN
MADSVLAGLGGSPAAERVREELEACLLAEAERLLAGAGRRLGRLAAALDAVASGRSPGLEAVAGDAGRRYAGGRGPARAAVESTARYVAGRAGPALRRRLRARGPGTAGRAPVVVLGSVDVGTGAADAYDHWMTHRGSPVAGARVVEEVPGVRVVWVREGDRGTVRGVATFHRVGEDLTRVLLVAEFPPRGRSAGAAQRRGRWGGPARRVRSSLTAYAHGLALRAPSARGAAGADRGPGDRQQPDARGRRTAGRGAGGPS